MNRKETKITAIGNTAIGGKNPIAVQSMTNTKTSDFEATYAQTKALEDAGCDLVRITVPDKESAGIFYYLKNRGIKIPLIADIHFDYRLAIESCDAGADKIRINPGNIGSEDRINAVTAKCNEKNIPIRVGVNSGSLQKEMLEKYGSPTPEALAESALESVALLERYDFDNIVVAIKSSDPKKMIEANRVLSDKTRYPIHLGVTEAGGGEAAVIKSAVGIGALLSEGIGDTIRVSLTSSPVDEVYAARGILSALSLNRKPEIEIISCPTCGRTEIDLISLSKELDAGIKKLGAPVRSIKVALMGCAVNGPGEAREADVGVAGGKGDAVLFRKGEIIRKIREDEITDVLISEIKETAF